MTPILKQNYDDILIKDKPVVKTIKKPTQDQVDDLNFANKIVKHTKSNAIVLVKNKVLLSSGMGQSSRIDALEQAVLKADKFENSLENSVMASDAFFPFSDCIQRAHEEGIVSVIQPGGSIRDKESIELCDKLNISMVMTDTRHFKH